MKKYFLVKTPTETTIIGVMPENEKQFFQDHKDDAIVTIEEGRLKKLIHLQKTIKEQRQLTEKQKRRYDNR